MHPTSESHTGYYGWRVALVASLAVTTGFGSILIYTFGIFLKPLNAEFGWTRETISTAFACASLTLGLCSPGLGLLLDRFGPRVILACITVFGLAFGSLGLLTGSLTQLFCVFVLIGAVGNGTAQMAYARVVSTWFVRNRGVALSLVMAGSGVGAVLVPIVCQQLIAAYGWRAAYGVFGAASVAIALPLVALFIREKPIHAAGELTSAPATGAGVAEVMRRRAFWFLLAALFLAAMSTTGTVTHLAALLTDAGVTAAGASYSVATLGAASLLGRLITGWLLDRFFGGWVAAALLLMTTAGLLVLSQADSEAAGLAAAFLIGFSMGGESDVTPYMLARYFGLRSLSTLYGLSWTAYAASAALGSVFLGRAFDATGSYGTLLGQLAVLTFVAAILMACMPRYAELPRAQPAQAAAAGS